MRATGRTLSEEPMTIKRSTSSLSCFMALWNISGRFSPKKTMSGFMIAKGISGHRGQCGTTCRINLCYQHYNNYCVKGIFQQELQVCYICNTRQSKQETVLSNKSLGNILHSILSAIQSVCAEAENHTSHLNILAPDRIHFSKCVWC